VTIREVAARAGVSHQTVSRVINDSERVNPETRARVEAAIQELGFQPNAIARFMAQGRTRTFACFSPNLTDYTFAAIIDGAETEARRHGYFLMSASAPDEAAFSTLVKQLVTSHRTEGLLIINPYADSRHRLLPKNVPVVFAGARPRTESAESVSLDDEAAGEAATQHLINLGHQRIALLSGPLIEDCSQDRLTGYRAALAKAGFPFNPELILEGDWSASSGYRAAQSLMERGLPFTALFAENDRMAIGAIRALREGGRRVPEDISVIGFDDMPLASYFDPPLTTVRQDLFTMGREAAQLLMRAVEQPDHSNQHLRMSGEIIIRSSTASRREHKGEGDA
jgi:LacI family repressor for deo operon, udp, cdd, tsx, nupC, and nupG